jgi:protein SCO1/2
MLLLAFSACQPKKEEAVERLPFYNTSDFTAEWIEETQLSQHSMHAIDTFSLHNQEGRVFSSADLKGKIYAANFFFTSCNSICPKMANNLTKVQAQFIEDTAVQLVSFSVMPWVDSVATLKDYAAANGIFSKKWNLLTGNKNRIYTLAR